jgi:hypothetical protein
MTELEQARARVVAQAMQVARLHQALRLARNEMDPAGPLAAVADGALDACEADSGRILQDIRTIMFSQGQNEFDAAWGRLEALLVGAGLIAQEQADGALPH